MRPTPARLLEFESWVVGRGRNESTARLYARNVELCYAHPHGVRARLTEPGRAPAGRRLNLASLRAWARFAEDSSLTAELGDLKMPRLERVIEKRALSETDWANVLDAIDDWEGDPRVGAAMGMICLRGFRVGDVCRLTSREVRDALETGILNYRAKGGRRLSWTIDPFEAQISYFAGCRGWRRIADLISPRAAASRRAKSACARIERAFHKLAELAGIDPQSMYPHRLRRTYAKHYLAAVDGDPVALQKHMGWASIQTAIQYVDEEEREVLDRKARKMMQRMRGRR